MASPSVFLIILIALAKFAVCSHGSPITLTFQDYWNLMLHDTPMPSAVRDHLIDEPSTAVPAGAESHRDHTDPVLLRRGNYGDSTAGGNIPQLSGVVLGVNGKPVTVDLDLKRPLLLYANDKKPGGDDGAAGGNIPQLSDVVMGVNGKPVTVDLDLKRPLLFYHKYNANDKKPGVGDGAAGGNIPQLSDVVMGVNGQPVTVDLDLKRPLLLYHKYNANDKKPGGDDGAASTGNIPQLSDVVMGVNGKSVTVDLDLKRPLLLYHKYNANDKKLGGGDGAAGGNIPQSSDVVMGVNGKSVTVDLDLKRPLLLYHKYNANDKKPGGGDGAAGGNIPQLSDVVLGVNGQPVTVDLDLKRPLLLYHKYNANDKKPGGRHGTKLPVEVGSGAVHHDRDDDFIDNLNARTFFLEKDLHVGAKLVAVLSSGLSGDTFLHREVADGIPFSSQETMEILRRFGVQPGSPMANMLEETIRRCEERGNVEERLFCATSFESMVDYILSSVGTDDLETLTTSVAGSGRGDVPDLALEQVYTVRSWTVVSTPNTTATACHLLMYPYTIFQCHRIPRSRTYVLKMVGEDGTAVDAATICHVDTSMWSPTFYVLRALGLRPGEETICHLMPDGDITWLPRRGRRAAAAASL